MGGADPYLGILFLVLLAAVICTAMVTLSWVLGPKKVTPYKQSPYECGVAPAGSSGRPAAAVHGDREGWRKGGIASSSARFMPETMRTFRELALPAVRLRRS